MRVTTILVSEQVDRIVRRLAFEVVERNRGAGNLLVLGILEQGAVLGNRLAREIGAIEGIDVPFHPLDVYPFRDDDRRSELGTWTIPDLEDRDVLLVDDVLFTGRTVRAALDAVVRGGRPRSIQLVALVDRGHREYPIQPDYVGRAIPTKHRERVVVDLAGPGSVEVQESD